MRVLFTHSYFLKFDPKQFQAGTPYPPLATLYAAALLRENNFEVKVHDIQFAASPNEIKSSLEQFRPDVFVIYDDGFNYLTKMCLTNMREAAFEMQKIAKQQNCTVVTSSSDSTDHYKEYLKNGADYIIKGEGEITLLELVNALANKGSAEKISGLIYSHGDEVVINEKRIVTKELDALPLPAWDLIDLKVYEDTWRNRHGYFSLNLVSTRGCPYKCNWCAKPIYGNRYNSHSPAAIINQLKELKAKTSFDHIWFADDIFGLKPGWLKMFADLKEKEKLQFTYKIQSRADLLLEEDNIKDLARSGCETVWLGAESGSQKILDAMDKGTLVEQIYEATRLLKQYKIKPAFFLQFGYPGETIEDIRKTIDMVNDLLPYDIGISVSYPLPGTPFYERVKNELVTKSNWTDSDDLQLMFKNEFSPQFYKQLHRYIHKSYRKHQSMNLLKNVFSSGNTKTNLKRMLALPYYSLGSAIEGRKLKKLGEHESALL
jgi:anaerobic magnesium-protoporphyrin IX monomethyl ester cyclase